VRHDARASLGRDAQQRQGPAAEEVPEEGAQTQSKHQVPLLVRANKDGGDVLPAQLDGHLVVQRGLRPLATSVLPHGVPAVRLLVGGAEPFEGGEASPAWTAQRDGAVGADMKVVLRLGEDARRPAEGVLQVDRTAVEDQADGARADAAIEVHVS